MENQEQGQKQNPDGGIQGLGPILRSEFEDAAAKRQPQEIEWAKDLRQYEGILEPKVLEKIDKNRSKIGLNLTKVKVRAMDARMQDMLFPGGAEKNYTLEPTPQPETDDALKAFAIKGLMAQGIEVTPETVKKAVKEAVDEACKNMRELISDQLTEGKYRRKARKIIHSGNLFGTGILKGPLLEIDNKPRWREDPNNPGSFVATPRGKKTAYFSQRRIWDIYPDPDAKEKDDLEYLWERHIMGRGELRALAKKPGFFANKILAYIVENPQGDARPARWETQLRDVSSKEAETPKTYDRKYEVLERWGYIDGIRLKEYGVDIPEGQEHISYQANIWLLGNIVIKAKLNHTESGTIPYHFYYFEQDDYSIWGNGIPRISRDTQETVNSANRAMLDNAAVSAGPQVEVFDELLHEDENTDEITPFKVWHRTKPGRHPNQRAVIFTDVPSRVEQLKGLVEFYKAFNDEILGIPSYLHGENDKGVGRTVGGLSMLMGAANLTVKDVVANFDDGVTEPFISGLYEHNMIFSDDPSVKGDFQAKALGSSSLVARELRSQNLATFANILRPDDEARVNRAYLLREYAKSLELPEEVMRTEEETNTILQLQAEVERLTQIIQQMQGASQEAA